MAVQYILNPFTGNFDAINTASAPSPTSFSFSNNQSSFADVTGFLVDPSTSHAFTAEVSIERITSGSLLDVEDTAFYNNIAYAFPTTEFAIGLLSDGSIALGGDNATTSLNFVKVNSDGTTDSTFATNLGTGVNGTVNGIAVQSNDAIVYAGNSTSYNGTTVKMLTRVSSVGVLDTTFDTNLGTGPIGGNTSSVAIQADQKILAGGNFTSFNTSLAMSLVRLNTNGTVDTAFNTNLGTGFDATVDKIFVQADQKILVSGQFTQLNGNTRNRLVRLNSDGTLDTTFATNIGTGFNNEVHTVFQQADLKIVVGGEFTSFNGGTVSGIVRLNSDGTPDTTFNTNVSSEFTSSYVLAIGQQSSGKLIIGGNFTYTAGSFLLRLNTDGTLDSSFNTSLGSSVDNIVYDIKVQPNDQFIAVGTFSSFDGNARNRIIRYEMPADSDLITQQTIKGVYHSSTSSWLIAPGSAVGDNVGVIFQMTDLGQMQYESSDLTGTAVLNVMKFLVEAL